MMKQYLLRLLNFWPPFFFSGIKVITKSNDYKHMVVKLKLRFWNANFVGTQYGGAMFSMTDPFYMLMLIKNLGPEYVIWDKSATIHYLQPGKSDVFAEFHLSDEELEVIKSTVKKLGFMRWERKVEIKNDQQEVIAEVEKVISIRFRNSEKK